MAEALLRARLERHGRAASIASAGLLYDGEPASPGAVEALGKRGIDLTGHRSRIMSVDDLMDADLILAMARAHVREASVKQRDAYPRTFTLKEFVRRADALVPDPMESTGSYLKRLSDGRRPADLLGDSAEDDVHDPIGLPLAFYMRTAEELDRLTGQLLQLLPAIGEVPRLFDQDTDGDGGARRPPEPEGDRP